MENLYFRPLSILLLLFVLFFCEKEFDGERPFVRLITLEPTALDEKGITLNGEFLDLSGGEISDYGFMIDANPIRSEAVKDPNILKFSLKTEKPTLGKFSFRAEYSLSAGQTYFIRAFAIQGNNYILGQEYFFKSKGGAANPTITDFTPQNIVPGDTILIKGNNFTLGTPVLSARLGNVEAEIIGTPSNTEILVRAPLKMPFVGRLDLTVGLITVRAEKVYQRLIPEIVRLPASVKYGASFLVECKNISKVPKTNQVSIGISGSLQSCIIVQENKNSLLVKLDDGLAYNQGDSLFLSSENLVAKSAIRIANPVLLNVAPTSGIPEDEVNLSCDGIAPNKLITKVIWNQRELEEENYSIKNAGQLITVKLPYFSFVPGENKISLACGPRSSAEMTINMDLDMVKLNAVQKNWQYAFELNNKIYLGLPVSGNPLVVLDPAQKKGKLEAISVPFSQIPIYACPFKDNQILALNLEGRAMEGQILNVLPNNSIQQVSKSENKLALQTNNTETPIINAVASESNALIYIYVSNGTNNFWEFNPSTKQFRSLPNIPFNERFIPKGVTLFDRGNRILAVQYYENNSSVEFREYRPADNTWQIVGGISNNDLYTDAIYVPGGSSFQFLLSTNRWDRYIISSESHILYYHITALASKEKPRNKKKVFFINDRLYTVDDDSIYRSRLFY